MSSLAYPLITGCRRASPVFFMVAVGLGLAPGDVHGPPPGLERFGGRGLQVLAYRGEPAARLQGDLVAGEHAEVDDLLDAAALDMAAVGRLLAVGQQVDLLRADREMTPVALEQVGHADEAGHEVAGGLLVDLDRRAPLLDAAPVEHGQAVAHGQRLFLVVGDVDEADPDLTLDALELELHLLAEFRIQRPQRLVEQEHLRLVDDGARQRDPLPLATGELDRLAAPPPRPPGHVARRLPPPPPPRPAHPGDPAP